MRLRRLKQIILTGLGLFSLLSGVAEAANVSRKELEQVEQQVKAQNLEHQRLQEQASKISTLSLSRRVSSALTPSK